jgi:ribosomal protein S18 acetylase RimI-like enzyme
MMLESAVTKPQVVDLGAVTPAELEGLWQRQTHWWREQLLWDVTDAQAALRRVMARGGMPGKAVQVAQQTVGYAYFVIVGSLGVIAHLQVLPEWNRPLIGLPLFQETVTALRQRGVSRIESACIAVDCSWLTPACEQLGFQTYWREFLRVNLRQGHAPLPSPPQVSLQPWQNSHVHEAAAIMQAAYAGSVEAESNALYRSRDGCHLLLDHILYQGGCGQPVPAASALARHRGQGVGVIVVTEIAPRQSHLVQVVVLPPYQGRGVGRLLLHYSMSQLAALQFETLSLIVSRANQRALGMYQAAGFRPVLAFPVYVWEFLQEIS